MVVDRCDEPVRLSERTLAGLAHALRVKARGCPRVVADRAAIVELSESGMRLVGIAEQLSMSKTTIVATITSGVLGSERISFECHRGMGILLLSYFSAWFRWKFGTPAD